MCSRTARGCSSSAFFLYLDGEQRWVQVGTGQDPADDIGDAPVHKLLHREIDHDTEIVTVECSLPVADLAASAGQHPLADPVHQPDILQYGQELQRSNPPMLRVIPAQQCLHCDDLSATEICDRLVLEIELVVPDGIAQVGFELNASRHLGMYRPRIEVVGVPATFLGAIHGDVCRLQQAARIIPALGKGRNADARRDRYVVTVDTEYRRQHFHDLVGQAGRMLVVAKVLE